MITIFPGEKSVTRPPTPPQSAFKLQDRIVRTRCPASFSGGEGSTGSGPGRFAAVARHCSEVEIKSNSAEIHQTQVQEHRPPWPSGTGPAFPFHLCAPDNLCPPSPRLLDRLPQGFTANRAGATIRALSDRISLCLQPGRETTGVRTDLGSSV